MRYWICRTPGKVEGPFERSALESMMATGDVTKDLQICPEGSETWQTLESLLDAPGAGEDRSKTPPTNSSQAKASHSDSYADSPIANMNYSFANVFAVGWKTFTENYGLLLGISFIVFVASLAPTVVMLPMNIFNPGANNALGFITMIQIFNYGWSLLVVLPLTLGGLWVGVKIARGEEVQFSDVWTPYHRLGWVLLGVLLLYLLVLIIYIAAFVCGGIPGLIVGFIVASASGDAGPGVISGAIVGVLIVLPIIFYGLARVIPMMVPIIDPKMGRMSPPDAMLWSLKRTGNGIAWSLAGLMVVMSLMAGVSVAACGLPYLFLVLPLSQTIFGSAYALLAAREIDGMLCEHCGYTRQGVDSTQCPECGQTWKIKDQFS